MFDRHHDLRVRTAAFEWLRVQVAAQGDFLPWALLSRGFVLAGDRIPLVSQQGIFKPRVLTDAPLSIRTSPSGPYDDAFGSDGLLHYRYRGVDPEHRENQLLRFAMQERLPLVYFHGIVAGKYVAAWPVFVVADDRSRLTVSIAVDDAAHAAPPMAVGGSPAMFRDDRAEVRRQYETRAVRQRLHQRTFRERVLHAYRHQCAFCRFRHTELLDAAHIVPDADPEGEPVVPNGLALCKLHHAAFDRHFLGVRPDHIIEVRPDLLREKDGPTLVHAIQAMQGISIARALPRRVELRPGAEFLEMQYDRFVEEAAGR